MAQGLKFQLGLNCSMRVAYDHHASIAGHLGNFGPSRQKDLEAMTIMTKLSRAERRPATHTSTASCSFIGLHPEITGIA